MRPLSRLLLSADNLVQFLKCQLFPSAVLTKMENLPENFDDTTEAAIKLASSALMKRYFIKLAVALFSSLLLGLMAEFATYSYCVFHQHVRPPLEGIPFFRLTVFLLSFSTFICIHCLSFVAGWLIRLFDLLTRDRLSLIHI